MMVALAEQAVVVRDRCAQRNRKKRRPSADECMVQVTIPNEQFRPRILIVVICALLGRIVISDAWSKRSVVALVESADKGDHAAANVALHLADANPTIRLHLYGIKTFSELFCDL
jgi:hypothetical protein